MSLKNMFKKKRTQKKSHCLIFLQRFSCCKLWLFTQKYYTQNNWSHLRLCIYIQIVTRMCCNVFIFFNGFYVLILKITMIESKRSKYIYNMSRPFSTALVLRQFQFYQKKKCRLPGQLNRESGYYDDTCLHCFTCTLYNFAYIFFLYQFFNVWKRLKSYTCATHLPRYQTNYYCLVI